MIGYYFIYANRAQKMLKSNRSSSTEWINKMWYIPKVILFNHKKERSTDTCYMNES